MPIVTDIDDICTFCMGNAQVSVVVPGFSCYNVCGREDCQRTLRYFQLLKETNMMSTIREITVAQFCGLFNLKFKFEEVDTNPYTSGEWERTARHYRCRIRMYPTENPKADRVQLTIYFSKGSALIYGVEIEEVLDCLASDVSSVVNTNDINDWAGDYGMEVTKEVERSYVQIVRTKDKLEKMFGEHWMETLLYHTQRM